MKNITISMEDDVARWLRMQAAKHEVSVSRWVGELLKQRMLGERIYEQAQTSFFSRKPRDLSGGQTYPTREESYDRQVLR